MRQCRATNTRAADRREREDNSGLHVCLFNTTVIDSFSKQIPAPQRAVTLNSARWDLQCYCTSGAITSAEAIDIRRAKWLCLWITRYTAHHKNLQRPRRSMLCGGNQKQQFVLCPFSSLTNQRAIKRFHPGVRSCSGFVQSLAWQIFSTSNLYFSVEKGNHTNRAGFSPALVLC